MSAPPLSSDAHAVALTRLKNLAYPANSQFIEAKEEFDGLNKEVQSAILATIFKSEEDRVVEKALFGGSFRNEYIVHVPYFETYKEYAQEKLYLEEVARLCQEFYPAVEAALNRRAETAMYRNNMGPKYPIEIQGGAPRLPGPEGPLGFYDAPTASGFPPPPSAPASHYQHSALTERGPRQQFVAEHDYSPPVRNPVQSIPNTNNFASNNPWHQVSGTSRRRNASDPHNIEPQFFQNIGHGVTQSPELLNKAWRIVEGKALSGELGLRQAKIYTNERRVTSQ